MEFEQAIHDIRIKSLLSQSAFAKEIGVSFSTVNRWESSKSRPSYEALKKIKNYCNSRSIPFVVDERYLAKRSKQE